MRNKRITLISATLAVALLGGCALFGSNPKPPSALESKIYNTETNYIPVVVNHTNLVQTTNTITLTNTVDNTVTVTNVVTTTPEVTKVTELQPAYTLTTKPSVNATVQTAGTLANTFSAGLGTLGAGAVTVLLGFWGWLRSSKMTTTSSALTQEIEAVRDFILTLPQGTQIDAAVTKFMQQHQTEAGVAQTVLKLIDGNTSDPTVIGVSSQLQQAINELTNPPVVPQSPAAPK